MQLVSYSMPWKPMVLMPVGDIQWFGDQREVALEKLKKHILWGVQQGAWFLGMGDYIDAFSPSNRQRLKSAGLYDNANRVVERAAVKLVDELYDQALKPSKGRWLGLLAGHHFAELRDGTTTDQYLARKLGTQFLGDCAYVRLLFTKGGGAGPKSAHTGSVTVWCHHGEGAGMSAAAPIQRLEKLPASWDADIFLMGHQSKIAAVPMDRCFPVWPHQQGMHEPKLYYKTVLLCGTGSFMKGYVEGRQEGLTPRGTYVEKGMMRPVSLGAPVITITPRDKDTEKDARGKRSKVWLPDIRASV